MFGKIIKNKIVQVIGIAAVLFFGIQLTGMDSSIFKKKDLGTPSEILPNQGCKLNQAASTSITYMASGTATTTLTCDLYRTASGTLSNLISDIVDLNIQLTASRTATILMIDVEYSMDNVDWYQNSIDPVGVEFTVGNPLDISTRLFFQWQYASSSFPGQDAPASTTDRGHKTLRVPVVARYVRAIFTMKGGNGAIWAEFIPKRQVR